MTDRKHFIGSSSYKRKEGISPGTSLYSSCHPQPKGNRYWRGALRRSGSAVGKHFTSVWHRFRLVSWPQIFISHLPLLSKLPPAASFVLTQPPLVSVLLQCVKELWIWRSLSELCQMLAGWRWMWLLKSWRPDGTASKNAGCSIMNTARAAGLPPVLHEWPARQEDSIFTCSVGIE